MRVTLGLAQMYPKLGDLVYNLDTHMDYINRAIVKGVDLLIFPELSLTGYQVQDLVPEVALPTHRPHETVEALKYASREIDLVVGFVREDERGRYTISNMYLAEGEIVHVHDKLYLPTYAMFDESRFFAQGNTVRAFDTRFGRVGMLICEDFWHVSPPYLLWLDGADMLLFNSASPGRGLDREDRLSGSRWVELVNQAYGSLFTSYVIHCNRVGYEDGKVFWGGSSVVDPNGEFLLNGHYYDEALLVHEIDLNQIQRARTRLPLLRDERPNLVRRELTRILQQNLG